MHATCVYGGSVSKTVQVRGVPDDIHRELRVRAAAAGLSLSQYLLEELERIASRPRVADVIQRTAGRPLGPSDTDIVEAVRSGRDRD